VTDLASVRRQANAQRAQALTMRYRARRQRLLAEQALERLFAPQILALMREDDLSPLEDVRPSLRVLDGGLS
jgi:hypothetical protein